MRHWQEADYNKISIWDQNLIGLQKILINDLFMESIIFFE